MSKPTFCYNCGRFLAPCYSVYDHFIQQIKEHRFKNVDEDATQDNYNILITREIEKKDSDGEKKFSKISYPETVESFVMNKMGIKNYCCRRMLMTTTDMSEIIH
jgi:DNA-directed RNA polymerase subunit N (RpoN/RPB10)